MSKIYKIYPAVRPVAIESLIDAMERRQPQNYVFLGETHDYYEILTIFDGSVGLTAGTDTFIVDAPAVIIHPPGEFHAIRAERSTTPLVRALTFEASSMPEYKTRIFPFTEENQARVKRIFDAINESAEMQGMRIGRVKSGREKQFQTAVCELELLLLSLPETQKLENTVSTTKSTQNFSRAMEVIKENIRNPLDTNDIARLSSISPSLLKKLFARYTGMGVMTYFRTQKIRAAIPMLRDGISVADVAAHFGFSDAGYFSTVFKKITGYSPSHYRHK